DANSLLPILEDDLVPYVDLRNYSAEGSYRAPVQVRKKGTAAGVEPLEISVEPVEILLELDRKISKYLPLTANLRGNLGTGYDLVSHTLSPAQAAVEGPMSILEGISELYTDFIDLEGRTEDFSVVVNILNRDPLLTIHGTGATEFRGFVRKLVPVRSIDAVPIEVNGLDPRFAADLALKTGSVRVEGLQSELDSFVPPENFLSVDCSLLSGPGVYTLPVSVNLPSSFNLVRKEPQEVDVTVTAVEKNGGGS
ncbi:MAG: hypothetical protein LBD71_04670, partial [Treponema sp.]|nr:hypothetical protein [Treponema sp.]